jgi:hypothetical protein
LSDIGAEALAKHQGSIYLDRLEKISDMGVKALAKRTGKIFTLDQNIQKRIEDMKNKENNQEN